MPPLCKVGCSRADANPYPESDMCSQTSTGSPRVHMQGIWGSNAHRQAGTQTEGDRVREELFSPGDILCLQFLCSLFLLRIFECDLRGPRS